MARRRQLETPSPEALKEIEAGIDRDLARSPGLRPPIADVVADAARHADPLPQADREAIARDKADAERLRAAEGKGLVAVELPLEDITADALNRDRIELDEEEMQELMTSISVNGLRLPIEVFEPLNPEDAGKYALVSGYRRLTALRRLNAVSGGDRFQTIPAFIREPGSIANALVSMIEENEIRSGLSQYERGRAAASAVHDGIFASVDEAVAVLFQHASKAKRSKIRSFAVIHEELGDMLSHGTGLNERQCLRLAGALRTGAAERLRAALERAGGRSAAEEWEAMVPVIESTEGEPLDPSRGGRPKTAKKVEKARRTEVARGITIEREYGPAGYAIRFSGSEVTQELVDTVMDNVRHLLEHG
ncbi:ParB/RepB/Spo0J family partition protein [Leisingera sp. ANG-DT]|uniref:ParB/RepB/Spo0J family partition protein n=1 Tax=Leisingera sp. ANG-DT TaxID=1577897 RepID=UPI00057C59A9|nr:ParB N-terminal domain-containing protein [Leisingera sp. ANG-DT]KIC14398.1 chromosome partitioning protein ParB [Leisingera sp. ANG-DT]